MRSISEYALVVFACISIKTRGIRTKIGTICNAAQSLQRLIKIIEHWSWRTNFTAVCVIHQLSWTCHTTDWWARTNTWWSASIWSWAFIAWDGSWTSTFLFNWPALSSQAILSPFTFSCSTLINTDRIHTMKSPSTLTVFRTSINFHTKSCTLATLRSDWTLYVLTKINAIAFDTCISIFAICVGFASWT